MIGQLVMLNFGLDLAVKSFADAFVFPPGADLVILRRKELWGIKNEQGFVFPKAEGATVATRLSWEGDVEAAYEGEDVDKEHAFKVLQQVTQDAKRMVGRIDTPEDEEADPWSLMAQQGADRANGKLGDRLRKEGRL
jgi:hypothetical protein